MTAYQALGPFISTFADSQITALLHNDNGEIVITDRDLLSDRLDELEQIRAEQKENEVENPELQQDQSITTSTSSPTPSSPSASSGTSESSKESVIETETASTTASMINHVVEDMDLSHDDNDNNDVDEHRRHGAGASSSTTTTSSTTTAKTKLVHSRSEGDLSLEEERAKAYNSKNQENNNNNNTTTQPMCVAAGSSGGSLTSSESFNNFLYWRDPVPILEDIPKEDMDKKEAEALAVSSEAGDNNEKKKENSSEDVEAAETAKDEDLPDLEEAVSSVAAEDTITKDANTEDHLIARTNEGIITDEFKDSFDASTMELFRPGTANDQRTSFSVFDPNDGTNNSRSNNNNSNCNKQQPITDTTTTTAAATT